MSGTFRNLQMTTLLAVSLAVVMVQRAEGYSHKSRNISSYGDMKEPTTGVGASSSSRHRVASSLSKDYRKETEVAGKVVPYKRFWFGNDISGHSDVAEALGNVLGMDNEDDDDSSDEAASSKDKKARSTTEPPKVATGTGTPSLGGNIVVLDTLPNTITAKVVSIPVPQCTGSTFCLNPPHYPSDAEIADALKRRFLPPVTEPPVVAHRRSHPSEENLCSSRTQVIIPKTAVTGGQAWDYVLNTGDYQQSVRVELCENENAPCRVVDNFAHGYRTFCKQMYVFRNLVGLGANGSTLTPFKMPSSCCCHIQFVGNPMLRMGLGVKQSPVLKRTGN